MGSSIADESVVVAAKLGSTIERDYWLLCRSCSWSETAYATDQGIELPREAVVQDGKAYHRRCGGLLQVLGV
ncbi:MAG: hypothetical protein Q8R28_20630 [Dehalococcoidia bacterium]|nr:hypothetical protein [Dehalococcoidia bacterium]